VVSGSPSEKGADISLISSSVSFLAGAFSAAPLLLSELSERYFGRTNPEAEGTGIASFVIDLLIML